MYKYFLISMILVSCSEQFSHKIVETNKETLSCLIGTWESLEYDSLGNKVVLKFEKNSEEDFNKGYNMTIIMSSIVIDKNENLISENYNKRKSNFKLINAGFVIIEDHDEIFFTDCSRFVLNDESIFVKRENIIKTQTKISTNMPNINDDRPIVIGNLNVMVKTLKEERMNWYEAMAYCSKYGNNWRLPTIQELDDLYRYYKIKTDEGLFCWSSSEDSQDTTTAWMLKLDGGYRDTEPKTTVLHFVLVQTISENINSSSKSINSLIGTPIKLGKIEVAPIDIEGPPLGWDEAKVACAALGDGWRLPTKDELNEMYQNKDRIGGFAQGAHWDSYWSSAESGNEAGGAWRAWVQDFNRGEQYPINKNNPYNTRAVRSINY